MGALLSKYSDSTIATPTDPMACPNILHHSAIIETFQPQDDFVDLANNSIDWRSYAASGLVDLANNSIDWERHSVPPHWNKAT